MEAPAPLASTLAAKRSGRWAFSADDLSTFQLSDLCNKLNLYQDLGSRIQGAVALFLKGACIYSCRAKILD